MAVKVEYSREDAERMLGALEEQIASLKEFNLGADYKVGSLSADRYAKFRARSGEIYTLGIVVKTRLDKLEGGPNKALIERFDKATVEGQKTIIKAGLKFMAVLSKMELLPMGAREVFTSELRALYDARERLRDERFAAYIDADLGKSIDQAEAVLNIIIDKAPRLLSFGET